MLLDRKRIRKWAKWVALVLAIVFAVSFVLIGVGQGQGGFDITRIFDSGCDSGETVTTEVANTELQAWLDALQADPTDTEAMLSLADYYEGLYDASQGTSQASADSAVQYYEQALTTDPSLKEVYIALGKLYLELGQYSEAARILNEATVVDPQNPDVYYYLGTAQNAAGSKGETILAWQKFLELEPESRRAGAIRNELETLTAPSTTSTLAPATTTTVE